MVVLLLIVEGLFLAYYPVVMLNLPASILAVISYLLVFNYLSKSKLAQLESKETLSRMLRPELFNNRLVWHREEKAIGGFSSPTRELGISVCFGLLIAFLVLSVSRALYGSFFRSWYYMVAGEQAGIATLGFVISTIVFFAMASILSNPFSDFAKSVSERVDRLRSELELTFSKKMESLYKSINAVKAEAIDLGLPFSRAYESDIQNFIKQHGHQIIVKTTEFQDLIDETTEKATEDLVKLIKIKKRFRQVEEVHGSVEKIVKRSGDLSHVKQWEYYGQMMQSEKMKGLLLERRWSEFNSSLREIAEGLRKLRDEAKKPRQETEKKKKFSFRSRS